MVVRTVLRFTKCLALIALVIMFSADDADAQRGKRGKRGKKGKGGELTILKNLPEFFVNDNLLPKYLKVIYKKTLPVWLFV